MICNPRKISGAPGVLGMSNTELQNLLRKHKLPTSGLRKDLCQRIFEEGLLQESLDLEDELKSPFSYHFGLDSKGNPTKSFLKFRDSDAIYKTWLYHRLISS